MVWPIDSRLHDIENAQWLEILHSFTFVKIFYGSKNFAQCFAHTLQELSGERRTDVLPALDSLFVYELQPSGPVQKSIGEYFAARQLLGHPVTVSQWNRTREAL